MAEFPKLEMDFPCEMGELEDARKITVSDHMNGLQYFAETDKPDSFVIDMECKTPTSRINRSLSRKGSQRVVSGGCGNEKKTNSNMTAAKEGDPIGTCSPKAAAVGHGMLEKPTGISVGATDHASNPQGHHHHHQITITANNMSTNAESRLSLRKNSFRRHSQSWFSDPKRVLIFFATLSCIGTMLLIYFTLTISQPDADNDALIGSSDGISEAPPMRKITKADM